MLLYFVGDTESIKFTTFGTPCARYFVTRHRFALQRANPYLGIGCWRRTIRIIEPTIGQQKLVENHLY